MSSCDPVDLSAEPSAIQGLSAEQKLRLTDILDRYLSALESGVPLAREELFAAHPDLAGPLATYIESLDDLNDAAAAFGPARYCPEPEVADAREKRLGDYRLLGEIGRGGMGVVYEAEQISLGRRVALKVLPFAAVLDSRQIARFKHEAQAAAQLDHPNIVSVFAVGVERGVHYYAMQLIDGQPLDRALAELQRAGRFGSRTALKETVPFSANAAPPKGTVPFSLRRKSGQSPDENRESSPRATPDFRPATQTSLLTAKSRKSGDRQEYFRTVARLGIQAAEALHAAHEHGVVHRDVKPSNLLLDAEGKLWITDFGLARCRSDATLTRTGDVLGTLRYMSPEQAAGQSALVDQRTDVYSLGITLYELLALRPAFAGEDGPALARRIEQEEPPRLRHLQPAIPADLETVVMKAMAKRREDRYTTAQDFADDLRRVLEGKPTVARPPTLAERLGKWARRHKPAVAVAAAVCLFAMLGMAAGTLFIARLQSKTEQNYARAEKHFREARDAVDRFGVQLAGRLAEVPGAEGVRKELLQEALRYYGDFAEQAQDNPALQADLASTNKKIGILSSSLGTVQARTGQLAEAAASYARAVEIQGALVRAAPGQQSYRHDLAVSLNNLGLTQGKLRRTAGAERSFRQALELQAALVRENPHDLDLHSNLGGMYNNLGFVLEERGRSAEAAENYQQAVEHQQLAHAHAPQVALYREYLSNHYFNYGRVLRRLGRPGEAARAALARRALWPADPQHLVAVAEELALATGGLAGSKPGDMTASECAEFAVATLRQAAAAGWKPARTFDGGGAFAILKDHPGFAALVKQ